MSWLDIAIIVAFALSGASLWLEMRANNKRTRTDRVRARLLKHGYTHGEVDAIMKARGIQP